MCQSASLMRSWFYHDITVLQFGWAVILDDTWCWELFHHDPSVLDIVDSVREMLNLDTPAFKRCCSLIRLKASVAFHEIAQSMCQDIVDSHYLLETFEM